MAPPSSPREPIALFSAHNGMCKRWVGGGECARAPDLLQKAPPLLPPTLDRHTHPRVCSTCCIPSPFGPSLSGVDLVREPLPGKCPHAALMPALQAGPCPASRQPALQGLATAAAGEPLSTRGSALKRPLTGRPSSLYGRFTKTQPSGWRANEMKWISAQCRLS